MKAIQTILGRNLGWRTLLVLLVAALAAGCGQKSEYIRFGEAFNKGQVGDEQIVQQYVVVIDPKTGETVRGLNAENFEVRVGDRSVEHHLLPSSNTSKGQIGVTLVLDQGGTSEQWHNVRFMAETVLVEIGGTKNLAAIMGANGITTEYRFQDSTPARGKIGQLKASNKGFAGTFEAIAKVKAEGRPGLDSKARRAIIVIAAGATPSTPKIEAEPGVPVVAINMSGKSDKNLDALAQISGGTSLEYDPNATITIGKRAMAHIRSILADSYSIDFKVKNNEWPLKYNLTYKNGDVNSTATYVAEEITRKWAMIIGITVAIMTIVLVVVVLKVRAPAEANQYQTSSWSDGKPQSQRPAAGGAAPSSGDYDDESTRAGTDAVRPTGAPSQSYGSNQPSGGSAGGFSTPSAPSGGMGLSQSPGDVTAGSTDAVSPPGTGYAPGGPSQSSTGGLSYSAGDATVGDIPVVAAASMAAGAARTTFSSITLTIESGPAQGREIRVSDSTKLGRGDAYAHISGSISFPGDPRVSREHSELIPENRMGATCWSIVNRSGTNQTYVNNVAITGPTVLKYNDQIRIGETVLRVIDVPASDGDATMR